MDRGTGSDRWRRGARVLAGYGRRCWQAYWRFGVAALVALGGLAVLTLGPATLATVWHAQAEQPPQQRVGTTHQVGDPVRDGPVTFVVHEIRCGPHQDTTHGRRCDLILGARNDGRREIEVPDRAQTIHVSQGARHLPTEAGGTSFGTLQPREAATAVIAYDLPRQATVTHVEVRAGIYSRGVPVLVGTPYPLVTPE